MAAAVAAPLAAGGEEAAATTSVSGSPGLPGSRSAERALEEAVATGTLNLSNRRLKHFPRGAARSYDLSDITQADLSRNRFPEVPEAACQLVSLEGLSLYHNCLRCLNPALGNLTALTYLNLSRNQLSSLPPYICQLPLRVLIVSNNKLGALPPDIGALGSLRQLDVSSNELQSLPTELCSLSSLRDLNVRRNQLSTLPDELGDLPLVRLDFSCNRVSRIPVSFCRLRHLQVILLDSNPLQSPPAQICLKGKLHIFKYLSTEAGQRGSALGDLAPSRPPSFSPCPAEDLFPGRRYDGGLDSGFHSVDSGSKRWSGNESTDEFSELSFRISELAREPRGPRERREDGTADGDPEQIDFIDSHVPGEDEERGAAEEPRPPELSPVAGDGERAPSSRREEPAGEERRRPDTLQLWQERERRQQQQQQQQSGAWGAPRKDSFLKLGTRAAGGGAVALSTQATYNGTPKSNATQLGATAGQGAPSTASTSQEPLPTAGPATAPAPRPLGSIQRPNSFLFRSSSQSGSGPSSPDSVLRPRRSPQVPDEKELMAQLRQVLESRLQRPLPEDLAEALANGVILCQLANQLRPRAVPFIHVPSPAVPKLSALKSRKNVESFLEACRKMGVPEESLCQPHHILEEEGAPGRGLPHIAAVVHALLERP
ncbi:PREDICTED: leucine-rich repeat and calponin homology domain-containing protein 4 isoform X2 [Propithecus coquereli]|uniref:leucine-rich repeat and calponin homology domain-containing protein 4 isoform X2 n=1 Tax=Propithecus coquereli TaxID=379532 RepID=UPI00063F0051|nr:PREDICTED: leucine-rich repeat and calponin homology domain-containing protein 4 isoform X2 [Propithecus coquereli]